MKSIETVVSRRRFVAAASSFGLLGLRMSDGSRAFAAELEGASRLGQVPVLDGGFASARKTGEGVFATIADPSKGAQATCNGGFLIGKDAAFLIEGFNSVAGAAFQMAALRKLSGVPVMAALDTHYHYDHSMGNSFYGAQGIPLWSHAATAKRMVDAYAPMQGAEKDAVLAPYLKRVRDAKSELARAHAQTDVNAMVEVFSSANGSLLGLPNHPLDPAMLPVTLDLGGVKAILEYYAGHSGTDIVVRVPGENIVFTGDLVFNGKYPVCFDEQVTVSGWRETLKKFAAFERDTVFVPGHGPICGQAGIAAMQEVFDDLAEQAVRMRRAGIPVEEAQRRYVVPERFKALPIWSWGFTIGSAIRNLYAEWGGAKSNG